jgi:hypothetical protein
MKYLESYKCNQRKKINLNSKLVDFKNKFPTGKFMIFICRDYDWGNREGGDVLYLGKIGNIEHAKEKRNTEMVVVGTYLKVLLLDLIMEIDLPYEQFSTKEFSLDSENNFKQILFTSNSREESQKEFDELKEQEPYSKWKENMAIRKNMRKFNI